MENEAPFDIWTIPHLALGYLAAQAGAPLGAAIWGAVAIEAVEIALSRKYPDLARESRRNQLGDLAVFLGGYQLGDR
jgi:hypothetical protein